MKTDGAWGAAEGLCWISRGGGVERGVGSPGLGPAPGLSACLERRGGNAASHQAAWEPNCWATVVTSRRLIRLGDLRQRLPKGGASRAPEEAERKQRPSC